jgi:hypothetical protein
LISLFIYVFYRTEKTLVNQVIIALFSYRGYTDLKINVTSVLPLKDCIIYSLPEGLWVFCITVMSGPFLLKIRRYRWNLVTAPLLISLLMELFQLLHFTNGRFDWMDIIFASGFWLLGYFLTRTNCKVSLFQSFDAKTICCIFCYSIVYLAHVFY